MKSVQKRLNIVGRQDESWRLGGQFGRGEAWPRSLNYVTLSYILTTPGEGGAGGAGGSALLTSYHSLRQSHAHFDSDLPGRPTLKNGQRGTFVVR